MRNRSSVRWIRTAMLTPIMVLLVASVEATDDLPRTPQGLPDLSGTWNYGTLTPLERPAQLADKSHFTPEEARDFVANFDKFMEDLFRGLEGDEFVGVDTWLGYGTDLEPDLRTSRVVDPADGRIPRSKETRKRGAEWAARRKTYSDPEVLMLQERCLAISVPVLRTPDSNYVRIVQTPDYVVIAKEFPQTRIIPMDSAPRFPGHVRFWNGESRGRWEGETLVVETRNVRAENSLEGSGPNMTLTERFSLTAKDQLRYEFTVDDPESFDSPWTALTYIHRSEEPIYEYACHEGNLRSMTGIFKGSRLLEKEAAAAID